jgi:D-glycerate 3-kinase
VTPLAEALLALATAEMVRGARVIFIAGPQGVGKSTAMAALTEAIPGSVALGLDDFYLTRAERMALARDVHPLFETRGPPGTHDVALLMETIERLKAPGAEAQIAVPVFDKAMDERRPEADWPLLAGAPRVIFVEGWMMGVAADLSSPEAAPLNAVEAEDVDGVWRAYQETQLAGPYQRLWDMADAFLYIDAPGFDVVKDWRMQQEETTLGVAPGGLPAERQAWVSRFILHYQRLTERLLAGERRPGQSVAADRFREPV